MTLLAAALLLGCGRAGRPLPAQPAPAVTLEALRLADGGVIAALGCPGAVERAEVALWRAETLLGEGTAEDCTVLVPAGDVMEGETLRLTGAVLGAYGLGQRTVLPVRLSGEVKR